MLHARNAVWFAVLVAGCSDGLAPIDDGLQPSFSIGTFITGPTSAPTNNNECTWGALSIGGGDVAYDWYLWKGTIVGYHWAYLNTGSETIPFYTPSTAQTMKLKVLAYDDGVLADSAFYDVSVYSGAQQCS